jgi:Uma2 family endonuclease
MKQFVISLKNSQRQAEFIRLMSALSYVESVETYQNGHKSLPKLYEDKADYTYEDLRRIVRFFPKGKKWIYQDILDYFPPHLKHKVEIIENQLFIMASPKINHQIVSAKLHTRMRLFADQNNLGEVLAAPCDVVLDDNNVCQPDILFVSNENASIIDENCIKGAPDLVVEIDSPSNTDKQKEKKRKSYERFGVKEYWNVKIKEKEVKVETLEEQSYQTLCHTQEEGSVYSKVLKGFAIKLNEIV